MCNLQGCTTIVLGSEKFYEMDPKTTSLIQPENITAESNYYYSLLHTCICNLLSSPFLPSC